MNVDIECRRLAERFLAGYRLSPAERADETPRLARAIQCAAEAELEGIAERLLT